MKTQTINFKKTAATACAALLIATGSYTQSDAGISADLENLIAHAEKSVRYTAPSVPASEVYVVEMERLNALAEATEASLKYEAPAADENEVAVEMERLEWLTATTEASLKYEAPSVDEDNVTVEKERLEWLAASTEASLRYNAPDADAISEIGSREINEAMFASITK